MCVARLQIRSQGRLDVLCRLAQLYILEGADEVTGKLLDRKAIGPLSKHSHLLQGINQPLARRIELNLRYERAAAKDSEASLLEALGHVRLPAGGREGGSDGGVGKAAV